MCVCVAQAGWRPRVCCLPFIYAPTAYNCALRPRAPPPAPARPRRLARRALRALPLPRPPRLPPRPAPSLAARPLLLVRRGGVGVRSPRAGLGRHRALAAASAAGARRRVTPTRCLQRSQSPLRAAVVSTPGSALERARARRPLCMGMHTTSRAPNRGAAVPADPLLPRRLPPSTAGVCPPYPHPPPLTPTTPPPWPRPQRSPPRWLPPSRPR